MTFTVERHEELRAGVVRIVGDIDIATIPPLRDALDGLVEAGYPNIVMDLSRVDYADSSALGMLVWLDRRLQDTSGRVVLAGANRDVRRILALSRILNVARNLCEEADADEALGRIEPSVEQRSEMWSREISVPADVGKLASVREQVCDLIEPLGFSGAAVFDIKVALGEALANAIRHGSGAAAGEVLVRVHCYDEKVVLEIVDSGSGFDGEHVCSDDLYASGGRGIMFMRALMDHVEFAPADTGGTTVTLVKHRIPAEVE